MTMPFKSCGTQINCQWLGLLGVGNDINLNSSCYVRSQIIIKYDCVMKIIINN